MQRTPVDSSNIASVGYDEDRQVLEIEFQGGEIYQYSDVPKSMYERLMSAGSKGQYFRQNIKDTYKYDKVTG